MLGKEEQQIFQSFVAAFDTPAFSRRARQVEDAWQALLEGCRQRRAEWLQMPRLRLAQLAAQAQPWPEKLSGLCQGEDAAYLEHLHADWKPQLRAAMPPARKDSEVAGALAALITSFQRFNTRWSSYLEGLDLGSLNRLREGYNRYYLLEKECALRSSRTAHAGFVPLPMVSVDGLLEQFPLLRVPQADIAR